MADWWVHVNRGIIDSNRKHGKWDAPITIKKGKSGKAIPCYEVELPPGSVMLAGEGGSQLLPCGARVAIRCPSEPTVLR